MKLVTEDNLPRLIEETFAKNGWVILDQQNFGQLMAGMHYIMQMLAQQDREQGREQDQSAGGRIILPGRG